MRIAGLVTCVSYGPFLAEGLERWVAGLDQLLVVTTADDSFTHTICGAAGVKMHWTDAFARDGAVFNKAAAMDEGLAILRPEDWVLCFDADVVPPHHWRAYVESAAPVCGNLYAASRQTEAGLPLNDGTDAGFFHLWHVQDPAAQDRPLFGSWHNASGYDSAFADRWLHHQRLRVPVTCTHLGERGTHWCGLGRRELMDEVWRERERRGGWRHERLR